MILTTGQAIVKFLNNQYISFDDKESKLFHGVFTLFGHGNVLGLGQALAQNAGDLAVYQGKNEQGMAHAAIAYAKQMHRKKICICTSSIGPGAANMVTAAGTATANNIPVLFLPGDTHASRQPDPVLQQVEHTHDHGLSTNDAFRAVSRYFDRIQRPEQIMTALIHAMRCLTDPSNAGAVTIALPQDVQGESYDYPDYFFAKRVHEIPRTPPTPRMLSLAVDAIKHSKKPMIICGGGVRYSEAGEILGRFAEDFNIPFGETQAGKSALPYDHPLNMGGVGVTGGMAANIIANGADLVIGIGTRYTDFTSASKSLFSNPNVKYLNINISPFQAGKMDGIQLIADAKIAVQLLSSELKKSNYKSSYASEYKLAKEKWNKEINRLFQVEYEDKNFVPEVSGHLDDKLPEYAKTLKGCLTQTEVLGVLQDQLDPSAVVVGSSGSLPGCMQRIWLPKEPNTYHMEYGYSCMGYEICGALGVKIAEQNKEVYAMVGDGSFLMLHSELITSLQMDMKINVILLDNSGFGCINNLQMSKGIPSFGTEFRKNNSSTGDIMTIDYAKVAEGYGAKSYSIHNKEELISAISDSKKQPCSVLLDIKVLPKTMTDGYDAWWNVCAAEVAESEAVNKAYNEKQVELAKARKY